MVHDKNMTNTKQINAGDKVTMIDDMGAALDNRHGRGTVEHIDTTKWGREATVRWSDGARTVEFCFHLAHA